MPIVLLCGIPGAGKTTLSQELLKEVANSRVFSFDEFVVSQLNDASTSCTEDINGILKPAKVYRKLWETFIEDFLISLTPSKVPLIILDDNFYLQSQRRSFIKIGRRYGLKSLSVKIVIDIEVAVVRNEKRNIEGSIPEALKFDEDVIRQMNDNFEDSGIDYFFNTSTTPLSSFFDVFSTFTASNPDAFSIPLPSPPPILPPEPSFIHEIDLLSRRIANNIINNGHQKHGKVVNELRRNFLEDLKQNQLSLKLDRLNIIPFLCRFTFIKVFKRLMASKVLQEPIKHATLPSTSSRILDCNIKELNLGVVLLNGQSFRYGFWLFLSCKVVYFRWKKLSTDSEVLIGVACHRVWKLWRINDCQIGFEVLASFQQSKIYGNKDDEDVLKDYFQLNVDLSTLYADWQALDPYFSSILKANEQQFEGIRILNQPLLETILSFICSANNNISRISNMVNTLASLYGEKKTLKVDDNDPQDFYDFPSIKQLSAGLSDMEVILRKKGFGYRAKYIAKSVEKLSNMDKTFEEWEASLKKMEYSEAKAEILKLDGVGPKVADCICLMALGQHHVVPVDTHVFQITALNYLPELKKSKNVTEIIYKRITEFYANKFGSHAGWAHSVLFSTRLKRFKAKDEQQPVVKKKK